VRHGACWFVEGVRREEDSMQVEDAPLVISLSHRAVDERSSTKDAKEVVEKFSSWFPLPWGWGSSQSLSATEKAQEPFRRKMHVLSLYDNKEKPSAGSIDGSLARMRVFTQNNTILMLSSDKGLQMVLSRLQEDGQ
jgi:hypothetical protein